MELLLHTRARILLFFLFLWAVLITAHLFYYSIWEKEYYLERGRRLSEKSGIIPARRGMIVDKNKLRLAWNERYYDLYLTSYSGFPGRQKRIFQALRKIIPDIKYTENNFDICLRSNIPPSMQLKSAELIRHFPEIELRSRVKRIYADYPGIKKILGEVESRDGVLRGISGLEKQYNLFLKGRNGYFTVMVDRVGRWIPGTWREKQKAKPGKDLVLQISVEELTRLFYENSKNRT